ncbi:hypothetical protein [Streptomyces varsoviensis]|uniref:hypothetical protein n=1 Tax=Streptomyces varsoviensis TaxID=67373 RepID=UPI00068D6A2E|nr:hypothetical protein [Streptomyces varsoviensis]
MSFTSSLTSSLTFPSTPPPCAVPAFPPVRMGPGGHRLRRAVRRRGRAVTLGLAMAVSVAALAVAGLDPGAGTAASCVPSGTAGR